VVAVAEYRPRRPVREPSVQKIPRAAKVCVIPSVPLPGIRPEYARYKREMSLRSQIEKCPRCPEVAGGEFQALCARYASGGAPVIEFVEK